jgi:hypothetical protein
VEKKNNKRGFFGRSRQDFRSRLGLFWGLGFGEKKVGERGLLMEERGERGVVLVQKFCPVTGLLFITNKRQNILLF